jgi:ATP/ADP translocase
MLQLISTLLSIKPNEWKSVLYFFLITLTFSFGASIARSIGMTLVVQHLGGENLPQIFMLIDLCAMFGFIAYAKYTKRVSGLDILGFFLLSVAIFSVLGMALFMLEYRWVYGFFMVGFYFFYILISIHVGSVVASYFTSVQLKRVTGFINTGMPIGGALGGGVLILLLQFIPPQWLVLMLGLAALAAFGLVRLVHAKLSPVRAGHALSKSGKPLLQEFSGAFSYIIHSRLMLYMSLGLILFVLCNKLLEYQYQALIYPKEFPDATQRATFFATYELVANLLWLSIQLFFTSRIIVRLGVGASNLLHPIMATLVSIGLILHFGFYAGFLAQFVNQEMRGALRTPANNLLFNAIPPNMWGITKAFLNGIVFPLSTFAASTSLLLMRNYMDDDQLMFLLPLLSLFLAVIGIAVALPQWAAYNEGVFGQLKRFVPSTDGIGKGMGNVIEDKLNSAVPQDVSAALGMIRVLHLTE